ncbi:MAG: hypothetical protein FWD76_05810 [Firmicutes bacterium]|nr:hypothetical protein [Bacillota bacterium]
MTKPKMKAMNLQTITGLLISEQCNYKKCIEYKSLTTDPMLADTLDHMAACHKTRYEKLLAYLESHS